MNNGSVHWPSRKIVPILLFWFCANDNILRDGETFQGKPMIEAKISLLNASISSYMLRLIEPESDTES